MLRVNSLSVQEVRELFSVRAALEVLAATQTITSSHERDATVRDAAAGSERGSPRPSWTSSRELTPI